MAREHTLYLVATPIGHLDDIGLRALETLREVDRVFAEDTRHSARLLRHHGIASPLVALHEHNERGRAKAIAAELAEGGCAALISDAGTPAISDPGYRLVRACIEAGVTVSPVPGPSALLAALVVSGLPTDRFEFAGFPPSRGAARRAWLGALADRAHTLVLYESPHRVRATLDDIASVFGAARPVVLARELTKRFETVLRGDAVALGARLAADPDQCRGEFVLVIGGTATLPPAPAGAAATAGAAPDDALEGASLEGVSLDRLLDTLGAELPPKRASQLAAELTGLPKRALYARLAERKA